ncbi:PAS domain-containing sensor histidine kinase [Seonamhaeicola marinus]|uniref:histidine kinase n=1 Tax=Seonamhaeicola marinus TaxID=1912246 RepID=A0A5D0HFS8_9FLAO|nr:PAS domain-containing sensor histidine kinase [Seonamhaeicola marinus]TYA70173.1 PAS domain-containing protein [Seonamhaeicola marinus]
MLLSEVLNKTVDDIDIAYWELKDNDEILWSKAFLSSLGYSEKKVDITLNFFLENLIHREDSKQFKNNFFGLLKNGTDFRQSMLIKSEKGKYKEFVCTTNHNFSFKENKTSKFIFFNKRKFKTNKKVKNAKFYYKETAEMTKTGSWYIDFLKQKSYWDQQTRRILGYEEDYIPSLKHSAKYYPEEHQELARQTFMECALHGKSFNIEIKMLTRDEKKLWVRAMGKPVYNNDKEIIGVRGVFQDIDKSKARELSLLRTSNIIASQNKRLFNFAHIVSHNLRSHSSNLSLIAELIESYSDPNEKMELMSNFGDVAKSLNDTIEHLNEVLTIQTSTNKSKSSVNFNNTLCQVLISISQIIINQKAKVNSDFSKIESIDYIPAYLESILLNLITNAIKYKHPDRDPIIDISTYFDENDNAILKVSDNGIGIDLDKYGKKLFGMYNTFHNNQDAKGIGLFITKNQVEALKGQISVESIVNQGTTFKIKF